MNTSILWRLISLTTLKLYLIFQHFIRNVFLSFFLSFFLSSFLPSFLPLLLFISFIFSFLFFLPLLNYLLYLPFLLHSLLLITASSVSPSSSNDFVYRFPSSFFLHLSLSLSPSFVSLGALHSLALYCNNTHTQPNNQYWLESFLLLECLFCSWWDISLGLSHSHNTPSWQYIMRQRETIFRRQRNSTHAPL